jgi:hypothetical protein
VSVDPTKINRLPERGSTDKDVIYAILDEGLVCHAGYVTDERPVVIPTLYARDGNRLLLHGSHASGLVRAVKRSSPLSIAVTHIDAVVVARTGFHSSANYRSVVAHGLGQILEGSEHDEALDLIVEALIPGRSRHVRRPTKKELIQTAVIDLKLDQASAKVRTGPPIDEEEDLGTGVWAGLIPISTVYGHPIPASDLEPGVDPPDYLKPYRRQ